MLSVPCIAEHVWKEFHSGLDDSSPSKKGVSPMESTTAVEESNAAALVEPVTVAFQKHSLGDAIARRTKLTERAETVVKRLHDFCSTSEATLSSNYRSRVKTLHKTMQSSHKNQRSSAKPVEMNPFARLFL